MNAKDLRRLSRRDLLEMLIEFADENERLKKNNEQMKAALQEREIATAQAGSLAEASLKLNGVFRAAQDAAEQYLWNVQQRCRKLEEETRTRCEQMLRDAKNQVSQYEKEKAE